MRKKGFTLIELIVVMAIISILVLLGVPKYKEYTNQARQTKLTVEAKELEKASQKYYISKGDWPRLSNDAYTSSDIASFTEKIYNSTGKVVVLEETGSYYDIDYSKLSKYITNVSGKGNYILQNPVGSIYYMNELSTDRKIIINEIYPDEKLEFVDTRPVEHVFSYTGDIQEFDVPVAGKYLLEVWGGEGGYYPGYKGGAGGYSKGEIELLKGEKLYVVVGGAGGLGSAGYNGGGSGNGIAYYSFNGGGGGATHIARRTGVLKSLSSYKSDILIVAGGGGGAGRANNGYYGGGLVGGGGGGTQTAGGSSMNYGIGGFGFGGDGAPSAGNIYGTGGGGGWYGGGNGYVYNNGGGVTGGGGGSSYIGGVINGQTIAGDAVMPSYSGDTMTGNTGNGYVRITRIVE